MNQRVFFGGVLYILMVRETYFTTQQRRSDQLSRTKYYNLCWLSPLHNLKIQVYTMVYYIICVTTNRRKMLGGRYCSFLGAPLPRRPHEIHSPSSTISLYPLFTTLNNQKNTNTARVNVVWMVILALSSLPRTLSRLSENQRDNNAYIHIYTHPTHNVPNCSLYINKYPAMHSYCASAIFVMYRFISSEPPPQYRYCENYRYLTY